MDNLIALPHFGFLTVTGRDAQKFLQGYTTCDLERLTDQVVSPGAICNIKGRMVCNFLLRRIEDGFLLRLDRQLVAATMTFLQKYIVFSKAGLHDMSDHFYCYGLIDHNREIPQSRYQSTDLEVQQTLTRVSKHRFELWSDREHATAEGDLDAWLEAEVVDGIVWISPRTTEEFIPQTYNLGALGGISFDKGCYLGQEIVARMEYRGELKNKLHLGDADDFVEVGTKIINPEGKAVGSVIASHQNKVAAVLRANENGYQTESGITLSVSEPI